MIKINNTRYSVLLVIISTLCLIVSGTVAAANLTFKAIDFDAQFLRGVGYTPIGLEVGFPFAHSLEAILGVGSTIYTESHTDSEYPESDSSNTLTATVWSLGLRYYLPQIKTVSPFFFGSIGFVSADGEVMREKSLQPQIAESAAIQFNPDSQYQYNLGLGAQFPVSGDWSVIAEAGLRTLTTKRQSSPVDPLYETKTSLLYSAVGLRFDF